MNAASRIVTTLLLTALSAVRAQQSTPPPFILDSPVAGIPGRYVFKTDPGIRYDLWESTSLQSWTHVAGWPKLADGMSLEHTYTPTPKRFFRTQALDEQPPVIVEQSPPDDAFAVKRFDDFRIVLRDATGINPASIRLTVGGTGPLAVGAPGLTFSNNTLAYDSGDAALGAYGQTITATLVAADTLGRSLTHTWSFQLESQPQVVSNIYVFGSPTAQRAGQEVNGPAAQLANRFAEGPIRANGNALPWSISTVQTDRVVITYTGATPPAFTVNQFLCNLCPTRVDHIFYRRITSIANNAATKQLTLMTTDVPLTDMVETGSVAINQDSVLFTTNADGTITRAVSFNGEVAFPRIGFDLAGSSFALKDDGFSFTLAGSISPPPRTLPTATLSAGSHPNLLSATARECSVYFTPRLRVGLDIGVFTLKKFEAVATGTIQTQTVIDAQALLLGVSVERELYNLPFAQEPKVTLLLGAIGPLPVYTTLSLDFVVKAKAELGSSVSFSFGQRSECSASLGLAYQQGQPLRFVHDFTAPAPDLITPSVGISLDGSVKLSAEPQVKFLVYGIAGASVGAEVYAELTGTVAVGSPSRVGLEVGVNATVGPSGPALEPLNLPSAEFEIWSKEWSRSSQPLAIESEPSSITIPAGQTATFSVNARASEAITYQWYHKGRPVPGATIRSLIIPSVNTSHAGEYKVKLTAGSQTMESQTATLTIQTAGTLDSDGDGLPDSIETNSGVWVSATNTGTNPFRWDSDGDGLPDAVETNTGVYVSSSNTGTNPLVIDTDGDGVRDDREVFLGTPAGGGAPPGFVQIPSGSFQMGDSFGEGGSNERPVHSVSIQGFFIAIDPVTKQEWSSTYNWAVANGYSFSRSGNGKANNHPVHTISWYDAVKWCNAKSEQNGLVSCYSLSGQIYRSGETPPTCDFAQSGFRLPTEAEWEKAARGNLTGKRFPWGDTVSHSKANYKATTLYAYDISPTSGFHPLYYTGSEPYTAPVGSFQPNAFGLNDMAGNIWEWCWDYYDGTYYSTSPASDPRGATSGSQRIFRGGAWTNEAQYLRVADRSALSPSSSNYLGVGFGFRIVRSR